MSRQIAYKFEVDWNADGSFTGEDESNYLLSASGNEEIANPAESAFSSNGYTSEASFTLINKSQRFSPTNSGSPIYNDIKDGKYYQKKMRFTVTISGTTFQVFNGIIKSLTETTTTPDGNGGVVLKCTSGDFAYIGKRISTPSSVTKSFYETGKDEGQLIAQTLSLCGLTDGVDYVSQDLGSGTPTIARGLFTIPWYWLDKDSPIEDCNTLAAACCGRFYYNTADKKYYYENAQSYCAGVGGVSQATLNTLTCVNIAPKYSDKELYENIVVTIKPRRIGDTRVLWEPDEVTRILPGQTLKLIAKLDGPVYEFTELDMRAMTTGGFDRTSDITYPTPNYNTQDVVFELTNTGIYHLFLRTFKLMGKPIEGGEATQYSAPAGDTTFWSTRNGKDRMVDGNPYIQTLAQAEAIGDLLAFRQGNFGKQYTIKGYKGNTFLRLGYRVTLQNTRIGIVSADGIIISMSWSLGESNFSQDFELFSSDNLYHYTGGDYFKIGTHSANSSKRLFY